MLILKIKQAATALKDGRLDEAYELARAEDFRTHREGQDLIGQLVRNLVARGQNHLSAERLGQALADCEKAERLGGNLPETAALRAAVTDAIANRQQLERRQAGLVATARQHIRDGWLSLGEQALTDVAGETAETLRREAEARRVRADQALNRAEQALNKQDWALAIEFLREARQAHASNTRTADLMDRATALVADQTGKAINQGRLDAAEAMLEHLASLTKPTLQIQELARFLGECRSAASCLDRGQPRQTVEILHRLSAAHSEAAWLTEACRQAEQAATATENLRRGPLGWFTGSGLPVRTPAATCEADRTDIVPPAKPANGHAAAGVVPDRFMLQVDTVGGFLVLRQPRVAIGPISSSRRPDLALLAEAGLPVVTIERQDDDYFFSSETPVRVNDMPMRRKLLSDGDQISLGPRCVVKFTLPSAASTSAVLHLSGCRLPGGDARRVILMDKSIVLGPGSLAHIRADQMDAPAVLHIRDGRLLVRSTIEVKIDGRPIDDRVGIPVGACACIGPISLAVARAEVRA